MTNINSIPVAILERILLFATDVEIENLADWISLLPLVSVSQQWAFISRPAVYNCVFIWYTKQHYLGDSRRQGWQTNAECIAIRGWHGLIKRFELRIGDATNAPMILKNIGNILQLGRVDWSSISAIDVLADDTIHYSVPAIATPLHSRIESFAKVFTSAMPNVVSLKVFQFGVLYNFQLVIRLLVNAYAMQLKLLDVHSAAMAITPYLGSQLVHLSIEFPHCESDITIASVCPEPLRFLKLVSWPSTLSWCPFYCATKPGCINFKNLEELHISYASTTKASGNYMYRLLFPNLRLMFIDNCPDKCDIMFAEFNSVLKVFRLEGSLENISNWKDIQLKYQTFAVVSHLADKATVTKYEESTNSIFKKLANYQFTSFVLKGSVNKLDVSLVYWNNLNELNIWAPIDLDKLLNLLPRIPRLMKLAVAIMEIESSNMNTNKINMCFHKRLDEPTYRLGLTELSLFEYSRLSDFHSLLVIFNFITRADSLTKLTIPKQVMTNTYGIIDNQKLYLPHLTNIEIIGHEPQTAYAIFN